MMIDMNSVRYAIKVLGPTPGQDRFLVVPEMDPFMSSDERVKIYEYVLRRQFGLAEIYADIHARDLIIWSKLYTQRPHVTAAKFAQRKGAQ